MRLDTAIAKWIHEQVKSDPQHAWFVISDAETAEELIEQRYVDYEGQSFLTGINPLDKRIGYVYDHEYEERTKEAFDFSSLLAVRSGGKSR